MCKTCAHRKQDAAAERLAHACLLTAPLGVAFNHVAGESLPTDFRDLLRKMGGSDAAN